MRALLRATLLVLTLAARAVAGGMGGPSGSDAGVPLNPSVFGFIEEFLVGGTSGNIGTHGWTLTTIGSAPTVTLAGATPGVLGGVTFGTAGGATAGQGGALTLGAAVALTGTTFPAGIGSDWDAYLRFKLGATTALRWRAGLLADGSSVPAIAGIWVRYDTNANFGDTTWVFECSSPVVGGQRTIETVGNTGAVRATNVVTIKTTAAHGFAAGHIVRIAGVTDATFNGVFTIISTPLTTTFTYAQTGSDVTSGSGTADAVSRTVAPSTIAVDATAPHTLHLSSTVSGTVNFSLDTEAPIALSTNCPVTTNVVNGFQLLTDTTALKYVVLDFYSFRKTGVSR
jgi:hypothetical protein